MLTFALGWGTLMGAVGGALHHCLRWAASRCDPISLPRRLGGLALAAVLTGVTYASIWVSLPHLPPTSGYAHYSLPEMPGEAIAAALISLALACAPAGLLRALAARPARGPLVGGVLLLTSACWGWAPGFRSWRYDPGWGRLALLGASLGIGFSIAGRWFWPSRPGPTPAPGSARVSAGTSPILVLLVLGLALPSLLPLVRYRLLRARPLLEKLDDLIHLAPVHIHLHDSGLVGLWTLLVAHLAVRWARASSPSGNPVLCGLIALHLLLGGAWLMPRWLPDYLAFEFLLVPPVAAILGGGWLILALAIWALRLRSRRSDLAVEEELARVQQAPGEVLEEGDAVALARSLGEGAELCLASRSAEDTEVEGRDLILDPVQALESTH